MHVEASGCFVHVSFIFTCSCCFVLLHSIKPAAKAVCASCHRTVQSMTTADLEVDVQSMTPADFEVGLQSTTPADFEVGCAT